MLGGQGGGTWLLLLLELDTLPPLKLYYTLYAVELYLRGR